MTLKSSHFVTSINAGASSSLPRRHAWARITCHVTRWRTVHCCLYAKASIHHLRTSIAACRRRLPRLLPQELPHPTILPFLARTAQFFNGLWHSGHCEDAPLVTPRSLAQAGTREFSDKPLRTGPSHSNNDIRHAKNRKDMPIFGCCDISRRQKALTLRILDSLIYFATVITFDREVDLIRASGATCPLKIDHNHLDRSDEENSLSFRFYPVSERCSIDPCNLVNLPVVTLFFSLDTVSARAYVAPLLFVIALHSWLVADVRMHAHITELDDDRWETGGELLMKGQAWMTVSLILLMQGILWRRRVALRGVLFSLYLVACPGMKATKHPCASATILVPMNVPPWFFAWWHPVVLYDAVLCVLALCTRIKHVNEMRAVEKRADKDAAGNSLELC
ncbi:hypothetical protein LshimejAT787_1004410 [Lyophyllum shimeji]|uniref:Uncharacterized protein n=1 Tax=Lyophyllum shimeji TaxID=47721 RepID=A0A9P3PUC4_LYOSH|nr:hypothetical protein LshimejAT787_1004410 [Lyophyllum shimeji]